MTLGNSADIQLIGTDCWEEMKRFTHTTSMQTKLTKCSILKITIKMNVIINNKINYIDVFVNSKLFSKKHKSI